MREFIAQTIPAVNKPSKKMDAIQCIPKYRVANPPKHIERKKPTQVPVQSVHCINSPKNPECNLIHSLGLSKIEPHTNIEVNPYAIKHHIKISPIVLLFYENIRKKNGYTKLLVI